MCESDSQCRFTRMVDGADHDIELAQLQVVTQRIQTALRNFPASERMYLGNALLNLAVQKLLCAEGSQRTASILLRLSDTVHTTAESRNVPDAGVSGAQHG